MENERNLYHDLDSILYSREEIAAAVRALGERITADYQRQDDILKWRGFAAYQGLEPLNHCRRLNDGINPPVRICPMAAFSSNHQLYFIRRGI